MNFVIKAAMLFAVGEVVSRVFDLVVDTHPALEQFSRHRQRVVRFERMERNEKGERDAYLDRHKLEREDEPQREQAAAEAS